MEFITLFPERKEHGKLLMHLTKEDDNHRIFEHGCDVLVKRFDDEFERSFKSETGN
jgi:hypothetical protein